MPKNFDEDRDRRLADRRARWQEEERDRSFVLGGEVFEYAAFVPASVIDLVASAAEAKTDAAYVRPILDAFPQLLDLGDDAEETMRRFENVKERVEFRDVEAAYQWIIAEIGRRPTQAPSPSGERRETNGSESTETSSSPQEASAVSGS